MQADFADNVAVFGSLLPDCLPRKRIKQGWLAARCAWHDCGIRPSRKFNQYELSACQRQLRLRCISKSSCSRDTFMHPARAHLRIPQPAPLDTWSNLFRAGEKHNKLCYETMTVRNARTARPFSTGQIHRRSGYAGRHMTPAADSARQSQLLTDLCHPRPRIGDPIVAEDPSAAAYPSSASHACTLLQAVCLPGQGRGEAQHWQR